MLIFKWKYLSGKRGQRSSPAVSFSLCENLTVINEPKELHLLWFIHSILYFTALLDVLSLFLWTAQCQSYEPLSV